jgi:hypothetical protein
MNWLLGVKDTNREALDGTVSFNARAAASNLTMKISASIATTSWIKTAEYSTAVEYACSSKEL